VVTISFDTSPRESVTSGSASRTLAFQGRGIVLPAKPAAAHELVDEMRIERYPLTERPFLPNWTPQPQSVGPFRYRSRAS